MVRASKIHGAEVDRKITEQIRAELSTLDRELSGEEENKKGG